MCSLTTSKHSDGCLVKITRGKLSADSLSVAEKFGKRHDNVVRDIRRIIEASPEKSLLNFEESTYSNERGKTIPMFNMTRTGFSVLAMGFTGKKALQWKFAYDEAFNAMEQALLRQDNQSWIATRADSKAARHILTDTVSEFIEYATAQGSVNAKNYYANITKMTNKALFLVGKASPQPFRDLLDSMQLAFLITAEHICREALREGMEKRMPYKDIYRYAKDKVVELASVLPQTRMLQ